MKINKLPANDFLILESTTLKETLVVITNNRRGTAVVIDGEGHFVGVVSDGDIRRAMLKGAMELTPVSKFVNVNSKFLQDDVSDEEIEHVFKINDGVNILPLINKENIVTSIAV